MAERGGMRDMARLVRSIAYTRIVSAKVEDRYEPLPEEMTRERERDR